MQTIKLVPFFFVFLSFSASVFAESPAKQLQKLTEQLQKTPTDDVLREKIVKLAKKSKPTLPDEAEKYEGRGKFAFKNAKSASDYSEAAKEYEKATLAAPWVPGYYSDLCTIYEKAEKYAEAKRNCEIYLKIITDKSELSETNQRIAGLNFGIEKAILPKSLAGSISSVYYWANWNCGTSASCAALMGNGASNGSTGILCTIDDCNAWRQKYFAGATCATTPIYAKRQSTGSNGVCNRNGVDF